jgi:hypothetical protein
MHAPSKPLDGITRKPVCFYKSDLCWRDMFIH